MVDPELTDGERLWLDRCRRCENQTEAAKRRGVTRTRQWRQELGRAPLSGSTPLIGVIQDSEVMLLYRRRSGLKLRDLAAALGVTHPTVLAWERTADPRLGAWWDVRLNNLK